MAIDMNRGRPKIDPTMPRITCNTHGSSAQSYIGRERYACLHCAEAEYDRLAADPHADEPASERPRPCDCGAALTRNRPHDPHCGTVTYA